MRVLDEYLRPLVILATGGCGILATMIGVDEFLNPLPKDGSSTENTTIWTNDTRTGLEGHRKDGCYCLEQKLCNCFEMDSARGAYKFQGNGLFNVDFLGIGDDKDAMLMIDEQTDRTYRLSLEIMGRFVRTDVTRGRQHYDSETVKGIYYTTVRKFECVALSPESLAPATWELLEQANAYATSSQFEHDLSYLLAKRSSSENTELENKDITKKVVYHRYVDKSEE